MPSAPLPPLLDALDALGPRPALVTYGADGRTELSGRVLANWLIKWINLCRDELGAAEGADVVIDMPGHWKRAVLAHGAWLMGARVTVRGQVPDAELPEAIAILATDRPDSPLAARADDVLALEPVSLALAFTGALGPLDVDWLEAVRAQPDQLTAPLPAPSEPDADPGTGASSVGTGESPGGPVLLEEIDGADAGRALAAWRTSRMVLAPASQISEEAARAEGL
ncbi:MAG: TIGR03089 family protein [Dermabacter sp.]|nr:TIGR03089 family protein [Dermabacter sp.]